uniref:Uncharacterized protein n=1 Tax=Manihot esculenta TaxID=3983 RepID=A0A2C9VQ43_MANES
MALIVSDPRIIIIRVHALVAKTRTHHLSYKCRYHNHPSTANIVIRVPGQSKKTKEITVNHASLKTRERKLTSLLHILKLLNCRFSGHMVFCCWVALTIVGLH